MTGTARKRPVWKTILRAITIMVLVVAMLFSAFIFLLLELPQIKSLITEVRMTCYVLAHHEELTAYALRLHDQAKPGDTDNYHSWETSWRHVAGEDAYIVQFVCRSWGIAPSTGYEGVYYSSNDTPYDFSQWSMSLDYWITRPIGFGWYWYKIVT